VGRATSALAAIMNAPHVSFMQKLIANTVLGLFLSGTMAMNGGNVVVAKHMGRKLAAAAGAAGIAHHIHKKHKQEKERQQAAPQQAPQQ
jgi:hypothetical protein